MPSAARLRRLQTEHEEMVSLRGTTSLLSFEAEGVPPTRYTVELRCNGLCLQEDRVYYTSKHVFDIVLGTAFPIFAPTLVWKTPIFHPNFRGQSVCMGDFWYPAWSLAEMCVAICEMVQYKKYNIYDPLDKIAAFWLVEELESNPARFPVDNRPIRDLDFDISVNREHAADEREEDR